MKRFFQVIFEVVFEVIFDVIFEVIFEVISGKIRAFEFWSAPRPGGPYNKQNITIGG